ncbi:SRPBCC family protein [Nocardioides sp. KIGAM211]|uniref:SRPBCC family protein n=1 Tax=Nocardioides luti TaxID=2761101 RepID=A0A7X0RGM7_9ACTN|nr:SRPBCC family protein [Nocardioides luti]MBB6627961.1 SRPBCC family protein [Nocardioides luti]
MTATTSPIEALEETIEVAAPPATVWSLVSDVKRMASWSPQVVRTFVRGGGPVHLGTRTFNINHKGLLVWPTQAKVVRFEPDREFAIRVKDNYTIWSFTLEPTATGGTTITQRRETPDGISSISLKLTDKVLGGQRDFSAELRRGMRQTLERIKAEAERG